MKLAVGAMGGDSAPDDVVMGAVDAIGYPAAWGYRLTPDDRHVIRDSCQRNSTSATSSAIHHFPEAGSLVELPFNKLAHNFHFCTTGAYQIAKGYESDSFCDGASFIHSVALLPAKKVEDGILYSAMSDLATRSCGTIDMSPIPWVDEKVISGQQASGPEVIKNMVLLAYRMAATNFYQQNKAAFGD